MLVRVADAIVFYLVTLACLTAGILTTKEPRDFRTATSSRSPSLAYLPTASVAVPKLSQHGVFGDQASTNGIEDVEPSARHFAERQTQDGYYSYLKPLSIDLELPTKDQPIKSITDKQRSAKTAQSPGAIATTVRSVHVFRPNTASRQRGEIERQRVVPQRSSYQVVEEADEYATNDSDDAGLAYRGKARTTYPHRDSQDVTMAIKALDRFLSGVLNDDSYNSGLHPPPNPVLALVLSRYGRYVPGARNPRLYAHTAVNNMHNNKPFGSYKLEKERIPGYDRK